MDTTWIISTGGVLLAFMLLPGCFGVDCSTKPTHTHCLTDVGTEIPMTGALKQAILKRHNDERRAVSGATDMQKLVWDDDLAMTAGKWARQCKLAHDSFDDRTEDGMPGVSVGQNAAVGSGRYADILDGIERWINEKKDFHYGQKTQAVVGHYTQVVQASSARIGCGMANCRRKYRYDQVNICNYALSYNSYTHPYKQGRGCSDCPNQCDQGLCDCKGKVCLNTGKLNLQTCTCECPKLYAGDKCERKNCPAEDKPVCTYWWFAPERKWKGPEYPCIYTNVASDCPHRCGKC